MVSADFTPYLAATVALLGLLLALFMVAVARLRRERNHWTAEAERLAADLETLRAGRVAAETARTEAATRAGILDESLSTLRQQHLEEQSRRQEAEKAAALATQQAAQAAAQAADQVAAMQSRIADWEATKAEGIKAAQAASLAVAHELSTKLLADHKRENEEAEKRVQKHTQEVQRHFKTLAETVATLNDQVRGGAKTIDTVWRALTSPVATGQFAEIGLENTLKAFDLERGRDFVMQYAVEGGRLRPDAVVFLPSDSLLVIDSKASKFFVELAETEDGEAQATAKASMVATMNQHLRNLAGRDYQGAIQAAYREAGRSGDIRRVLNVMYLPSDHQLERLRALDPDFIKRAQGYQIIPTGPAGLAGLVGFARVEINLGRQAESHAQIVDAVRSLMERLAVALGHADKVGRNLQTAASAFKEFSASVNVKLLPKARDLANLGVQSSGSRRLPAAFASFEIVRHDPQAMIEGDAEEVSPPPRELPSPAS